MCFVLDVNAFPCFFDGTHADHPDFLPLFEWLHKVQGTSLVIGGTKYRMEIGKMHRYLSYLTELSKIRKLSKIQDIVVDKEEKRIQSLEKSKDFDDAHLVALIDASKCMIFASCDMRADKYIKDRKFYDSGQPPSIYRKPSHKRLLTKKNIVKLANREN